MLPDLDGVLAAETEPLSGVDGADSVDGKAFLDGVTGAVGSGAPAVSLGGTSGTEGVETTWAVTAGSSCEIGAGVAPIAGASPTKVGTVSAAGVWTAILSALMGSIPVTVLIAAPIPEAT